MVEETAHLMVMGKQRERGWSWGRGSHYALKGYALDYLTSFH
jgi:hypothetical protein